MNQQTRKLYKIKVVFLGNGPVGRTFVLYRDYVSIRYETDILTVGIADEFYSVNLFDTAGQEEYDNLRGRSYPNTDVFLLCFSVMSPVSFKNVRAKWAHDARNRSPRTPFLLVGTQCDQRTDRRQLLQMAKSKQQPVSHEEAVRLANHIGAVKYIEYSALTRTNLKQVFNEAIMAALNPDSRKQRPNSRLCGCSCTLM